MYHSEYRTCSFKRLKEKERLIPRTKRIESESGIYHVMVKGINQSQLFYDDDDRQAFLARVARYKDKLGFELYAWSLMGNHVHFLMRSDMKRLSDAMKRILLSYSHAYNLKYDRQGYLFQDRYKSKPVEDDRYFLSVMRYIHRNPLEIGKPISYWTRRYDR